MADKSNIAFLVDRRLKAEILAAYAASLRNERYTHVSKAEFYRTLLRRGLDSLRAENPPPSEPPLRAA